MSTARKVPSPDSKQHDLFGGAPAQDARPRPKASDTGRRFVTGNPHEIVLGTTRLEDYLKQAGQRAPFVVAHLLRQQDWLPFEQRYAATGRSLRAMPNDGSDPVWRHAGCSFAA
jgi:hypothetical protein